MPTIADPLTLPCGAMLKNRLCKAAMTEGLAEPNGYPSEALIKLYEVWGAGGCGLLLTGNVQVDADHLERPGNVIIDREPDDALQHLLKRWASAAKANGSALWAQISHAGRQTQKIVNAHPKAPSAVKLGLPGGQFGEPVALTIEEIQVLVERFAVCAKALQAAGFDGIQIHSAHGYLLSQFLSPRSNQRDDNYGGSLENRARMLLEIVAAVRDATGPGFPIGVKLNSADFQQGGFAFEDSLQVARWLQDAGVDLLEVSGGTYEQPKLIGVEGIEPVAEQAVKQTTRAREAYFVDFALAMREQLTIPVMVTGGLRRKDAMDQALSSASADMVGIGRPMCVMHDAAQRLLNGLAELPRYENTLSLLPPWLKFLNGIKLIQTLATFSTMYWFYGQIAAIGRTGKPDDQLTVFKASKQVMTEAKQWLKARRG